MKLTQISLTPRMAAALLERNPNNRKLSERRAAALAESITRGEWACNGETIIVDTDGVLLDGQHRCRAVLIANKSIQTLLAEGVDPSAFGTIDIGKTRSTSDLFAIDGEQFTTALSGALGLLAMYQQNSKQRPTMTFLEKKALLQHHPRMRDACKASYDIPGIPPSVAAVVWYLTASAYGEIYAREWFAKFKEMKFDEPQRILARTLQNMRDFQKKKDSAWLMGIALKAINASANELLVKTLRFNDDETYPVLQ